MNIYKISPQESFLSVIADFIENNFSKNIDKLKVILPTGFLCFNLQKILIQRKLVTILPTILPFVDIEPAGEEAFRISTGGVEVITKLEEKIVLAEIIHSYSKLNYSLNQSLKFSLQLAKLFNNFINHNIAITDLKIASSINSAEHWQFIYEFLNYANKLWQEKLNNLNKRDKATYQINILKAESTRIKNNPDHYLIIAGIVGNNKMTWDFLTDVATSLNGYLILPPLPNFPDAIINDIGPLEDNALYYCKQFFSIAGVKFSTIDYLHLNPPPIDILDHLIVRKEEVELLPEPQLIIEKIAQIKYIEFENIFYEAEAVSLICKQASVENSNIKIAIIINNTALKEFYRNFLTKYNLAFQDLLGTDLAKVEAVRFIQTISELLCNEFDIRKLFIFFKYQAIYCENVKKLERLLVAKNRFIINFQQLLNVVISIEDEKLIKWIENIVHILQIDCSERDFTTIIRAIITIAEKLNPAIWVGNEGQNAARFFAEIIEVYWQTPLKDLSEFPEILKSLLVDAKVFEKYSSKFANIILCSAQEASLLKFDLAILVGLNEGTYPATIMSNPWFNQQMQEEIGLHPPQIELESLYYYYLLLHNNKVIITRAKKQRGSATLLPSSYLLKLHFILKKYQFDSSLIAEEDWPSWFEQQYDYLPAKINEKIAEQSPFFPIKLSVTDIETLLRNPYAFYSKKILKLRKQENVIIEPNLAEFGSFIHNVIEEYTKTYYQLDNKRLENLLKISSKLLQKANFPEITQKIWQLKFTAIAEDFVQFDEERRKNLNKIYSEVYGELKIKVIDQELSIVAIADRIEINKEGKATILDYKTGEVPTEKEIRRGMSPQLILEAMILLEGGFGFLINEIQEIVYVKITSSKPYIRTTSIKLTIDELNKHKKGLKKLLEYYIQNKVFLHEVDLLKYNDYKHLARRI